MSATGTGNDHLAAPPEAAPDAAASSAPAQTRVPFIKARQMVSASVGLGAVTIWSAVLGLVTTPYLIRHLGASRYGVFALITIIAAYLANLEFGFGHAMGRFVSRARAAHQERDEEAVLNTSLAVFLAAATLGATVVLVGAEFIDQHFVHGSHAVEDEALGAIRLGGIVLFFAFLSTFAATGLSALGHFKPFVISRALFGTLLSVGAIVAVALGGGLRAVVAVQVGIGACQFAVLFTLLRRATPVRLRPVIHPPTFRVMGAFGIMVLLAGLAYQGVLQGPPTVLAGHSSTSEVAAYAVPALVMTQLVTIATSTSLGFLTFASGESTIPDRTHLAAVFRSNLRMTLLVLGLPIAYMAVFAHVLLTTWIGSDFAAASSGALQFLVVAGLILALSAAPADVARALGRPGWVTQYTAVGAVIAIGGSFLLVDDHGAGGVAAAQFAALLISTVPFALLVSRGLLATPMKVLMSSMLRPAAAVACATGFFLAANALTSGFAAAVVAGVLVTALYVVLVFRFVTDDRERNALRGVIRRGSDG